MASLDDEIDRLYQQPLSSFTRERDGLARRAGADGPTVKRLEKPNAAAWAVNQVYWHRRKVFDRLTQVSERLRSAHERRLGRKTSDVDQAELAHRAAVAAAVNEAAGLLQQSGDAATNATLSAVGETFQTLVWSSLDGRLTRPRKPTGLEAISALMKGPRHAIKPAAKSLPIRPAPESRAEAEQRKARERADEKVRLERDLRSARAGEAKAASLVTRAAKALEDATAAQAKLEAALEKAVADTREHRETLAGERAHLKTATAERERIEARLAELD